MVRKDIYIRRCFDLARLSIGQVAPNPPVGAVVVWNGKIIGEGYHQKYGQAHAEVNAIADVPENQRNVLKEASIFVSLEPCNYHGNTPPCVDLILKYRIPKVYISCLDPNPKVSGQGVAKLRKAGVEVEIGILEEEGRRLLGGFAFRHEQKRPTVLLKYAVSANGFIGLPDAAIWLTNAYSKRLVHRWRSEIDAIIIGTNTAAIDNPQLTNRHYFGTTPLRVVLDRKGRLDQQLNLFNSDAPSLLVTERTDLVSKEGAYGATTIMILPFDQHLLENVLKKLAEMACNTVMVEGGAQLLQSFIDQQLWDEARIFHTNKPLAQGVAAPKLPDTLPYQSFPLMEDSLWIVQNNLS